MNEFEELVNQYEKEITKLFINIIDKAIIEAKENNLDAINTFIHINDKMEDGFILLASAKNETYYKGSFKIPVSEYIYAKLCFYIESYLDDAINEFKEITNDILNASSLEELLDKQNTFKNILNNPTIIQYRDLFMSEIPKQMKKRIK